MTDTNDTVQSGEARLKSRRYRFLRYCAIGYVLAVALGFITGFAQDLFAQGTLPAWMLFALWGLALAGFSWFTVGYFRRVDEVDMQDNLWACLVAFYFYAVAFPSWYLFEQLGLAPPANQIAIYMASGAVLVVTYLARKAGLR